MRNLVVVRCGSASLHGAWLDGGWESRSFDMLCSYYDEAAFHAHKPRPGLEAVLVKGGKWDGIAATLTGRPDLLAYDHYWFPDDDIAATLDDINRIFDLTRFFGLAVSQPALTRDSYFSHVHVLRCDGFLLRFTNHVEVMAPCLSRETLMACLPLMGLSKSGYGLDWIWTMLRPAPNQTAAVLDAVTVRHTRPVGSQLARTMDDAETAAERIRLLALSGLSGPPYCFCHGGITDAGKKAMSKAGMGWAIWKSSRRHAALNPQPGKVRKDAFKALKRHLLYRMDHRQVLLPASAASGPEP